MVLPILLENEQLLDLWQPYLHHSLDTAQILVRERHFGQVVGGPLYSARQHSLDEHDNISVSRVIRILFCL